MTGSSPSSKKWVWLEVKPAISEEELGPVKTQPTDTFSPTPGETQVQA